MAFALLAYGSFGIALLVKESIAPALGLGLLLFWVYSLFKERRLILPVMLQGLLLPLPVLAWYFLRAGNWEQLVEFLNVRRSYSSEFLAFTFDESLKFVALKPLIVLGLVAIVVKLRFKRNSEDVFLIGFFIFQLILFIFSAGYDRMGLLLLPVPALYLGELLAFFWQRIRDGYTGKSWKSALFVIGFAVLFAQQMPYLMGKAIDECREGE